MYHCNLISTCCGAMRHRDIGSKYYFCYFWIAVVLYPSCKNAWGSRSKNKKNNCKLIFGSRLSCFPASSKKNKAPPNTRDYTVPRRNCIRFIAIRESSKNFEKNFQSNILNLSFVHFKKLAKIQFLKFGKT